MERDLRARHYETVEKAIGFIRKNVRQQPTLEEIAQAVNMSPFQAWEQSLSAALAGPA